MACNAEDAGRCRRGRAGCAGGLYVCYAFQVHHLHTPRSRPAFAAKPVRRSSGQNRRHTCARQADTLYTGTRGRRRRRGRSASAMLEVERKVCTQMKDEVTSPQVSTSPSDANDVNDRKYGLGRVLRTRWCRDSAMEPWRSSPCGRAAASEISADICNKTCNIVTDYVTYLGNRLEPKNAQSVHR